MFYCYVQQSLAWHWKIHSVFIFNKVHFWLVGLIWERQMLVITAKNNKYHNSIGEECIVDVDPKHLDRSGRNPGVMCKTAWKTDGKQRKSFKEVIEEVKTYIIYRYFKKQKLSIKSGSRKKRRKVFWQFFYHLCFIDMRWRKKYTSW